MLDMFPQFDEILVLFMCNERFDCFTLAFHQIRPVRARGAVAVVAAARGRPTDDRRGLRGRDRRGQRLHQLSLLIRVARVDQEAGQGVAHSTGQMPHVLRYNCLSGCSTYKFIG